MPEPLPLPNLPKKRALNWPSYLVMVFVCVASAAVAYAGMRYWHGAVPEWIFAEYTADDRSFRVNIPGRVQTEAWPKVAESPLLQGGQWHQAASLFSRISASVRWQDLDRTKLDNVRPEDVFALEQLRRTKELNAKKQPVGYVKLGDANGEEVWFIQENMLFVERYFFVTTGQHPRLYVLCIGGSNFSADQPAAKLFLDSFQLLQE